MDPQPETSVQLPRELHDFLLRVAEERGVAVGDLIRSAVEARYKAHPNVSAYGVLTELPHSDWKFPTFDEPHW